MALKYVRFAVWGLLLIALAVLAFNMSSKPEEDAKSDRPAALPLTPKGKVRLFDLMAHTGERLTSDDLNGKYRLMYFGYTFCPDKCPLDLAKMALTLTKLEDAGVPLDTLQPLFITIDPERDTVEAMAETVGLYHERIVGLTGTAEEIETVARDFGVYYRKLEQEGIDSYLMDHMVAIFLYSPDGRYMTMFTPTESASQMVATLTPLLTENNQVSEEGP